MMKLYLLDQVKVWLQLKQLIILKWKRKSLNFYKKLSYIYNKEISKCSIYK